MQCILGVGKLLHTCMSSKKINGKKICKLGNKKHSFVTPKICAHLFVWLWTPTHCKEQSPKNDLSKHSQRELSNLWDIIISRKGQIWSLLMCYMFLGIFGCFEKPPPTSATVLNNTIFYCFPLENVCFSPIFSQPLPVLPAHFLHHPGPQTSS